MNKTLFRAAGLAGLLALAWVAAGTVRGNPLALAMTLLMAGFYTMGVLELHRFQQTTAGLQQALRRLPTEAPDRVALDHWLALVPAPLRTPVRLRVAGERAALPGPALAPYLAGLLVLLGMLGTFMGMVVTLTGTSAALDQASSVQGMRDALAAPVKGLGLAFGTSVAGVAASAMLGLMSALCRRHRQQAGQLLDGHTASTLQAFSSRSLQEQQRQQERHAALQLQLQQHEESLQLQRSLHAESLRLQAQQFPQLAHSLQGLVVQLDAHSRHSGQALLDSQQEFQAQARQAYTELAVSVSETLQSSLNRSAQTAAAAMQTAVQATMSGISRETAALHSHVAATVQQQLQAYARLLETQTSRWAETTSAHTRQQSAALLQSLHDALGQQQTQQQALDEQRMAAWSSGLATMAGQLEKTSALVTTQASAQARQTLEDMARLVQTATEAPRAAVQVMTEGVTQLRQQLSDSLVRDNTVLEERSRIMATLNTLLGAVQHTSTEQKAAIDQMVASTASWLQQAGARYTEQVHAESARLEAVSAQLTSSAVDVASLGEAMGAAVDQFSQSNSQLVAHLQRLEAALAKNSARSDDQLAYYVAQAREVIDLSLLSQKQIVDDLQRLASRTTTRATEAVAA